MGPKTRAYRRGFNETVERMRTYHGIMGVLLESLSWTANQSLLRRVEVERSVGTLEAIKTYEKDKSIPKEI